MKLDIQIFLEYILLLTLIVYDIIHKEQKVGTTFNIWDMKSGHANRGDSGALHLKSATAGANAFLRLTDVRPVPYDFCVEGWVLRNSMS